MNSHNYDQWPNDPYQNDRYTPTAPQNDPGVEVLEGARAYKRPAQQPQRVQPPQQVQPPQNIPVQTADTPSFEHCINIPGYDPATYPGTALRWGSSGLDVVNMQVRLNRLASTYTAINTQTVDGKYGQNMYDAVMRFQRQLGLSPDGVIGAATWNRIVQVDDYCASGGFCQVNPPYPGYVLGAGATGDNVRIIQSYMSAVPGLPNVTIDGVYGSRTQALVRAFQTQANLKVDGMVGGITWAAMVASFNALH